MRVRAAASQRDRSGVRERAHRVAAWAGSNAGYALAIAIAVTVALWAFVPGLFTQHDPLLIDQQSRLLPPSWSHPFGTDHLGRDMFARVVYGARASLVGAGVAVGVGLVIGASIGAVAAWARGWTESVAMRLVDVILSIPGFLLAIAIVAALGPGMLQASIAVGIASSATFARLVRSEALRVLTSQYIEAAVASGTRPWRTLFRHVVPNSASAMLSLVTVQFGLAIIWIASLSFIGLGAQPPEPEWGGLVASGRDFLGARPWMALAPAAIVAAVVVSFNVIARRLRSQHTDEGDES